MIRKILFVASLFLFVCTAHSQSISPAEKELDKFFEKRFGMFIHWGPVSLRGTEIGWSRGHQVSFEDYDKLYQEFNPVLFDARQIVKLAKESGMKYLTITAKHHDGFCLWPSKFTDYDIESSPYRKDIIQQLAKACKEFDIKFCIYYSVLDWYHPDYPIRKAGDKNIDPKSNMQNYFSYMKNQLTELVKKYDPYMLWFDGGWEKPWTEEMGHEMYTYLKTLKPDLIVNNRLGKEIAAVYNNKIDVSKMIGDYDTPEQVVGRVNMDLPWESCFTLCKQWSWKPNDELKSLDTCLKILLKTVGSNGNLLLNVGLMPDGRLEKRQSDRLKQIGDWLDKNGEAIYNTKGGPLMPTENYVATRRGDKIFIHVMRGDIKQLDLPFSSEVKILKASTLKSNNAIPYKQYRDRVLLDIPEGTVDKGIWVIELTINTPSEDLPLFVAKAEG